MLWPYTWYLCIVLFTVQYWMERIFRFFFSFLLVPFRSVSFVYTLYNVRNPSGTVMCVMCDGYFIFGSLAHYAYDMCALRCVSASGLSSSYASATRMHFNTVFLFFHFWFYFSPYNIEHWNWSHMPVYWYNRIFEHMNVRQAGIV